MKVTVTLILKKTVINKLQALITSATRCKAYHEPVCLAENRKIAVGLICLFKIEFSNQKCKQTDSNPTVPMVKNGSFYDIDWSFLLASQLIGRGYSAALRLTTILNLDKTVTKKAWLSHKTTLSNFAEELAEGRMKKAAIGAKWCIFQNRASEVPPEADLSKE